MTNLFKYWTYQLFSPGTVLREKYHAFKSLLNHDRQAHDLMAELEEIYYSQTAVDFQVIRVKFEALAQTVRDIIQDLSTICPGRYGGLPRYWKKFYDYVNHMITPKPFSDGPPFTLPLADIDAEATRMAGGKAASLAKVINRHDAPVPNGFVITTNAFSQYMTHNHLRPFIDEQLSGLDIHSTESLNEVAARLTEAVLEGRLPSKLREAITKAFEKLQGITGSGVRVAVRSSAVEEDAGASFAGQYRTELNVDHKDLFWAYKQVIASKYQPEAIYYRINYGLTDAETPMAVLVLEMIPARASGVMYTGDIRNHDDDHLHIHAIKGLGDELVSGRALPEILTIDKSQKEERTIEISAIDARTVQQLTAWGNRLESAAGRKLDIEWCQDQTGKLFLLQSRPLQTDSVTVTGPVECDFDQIHHRTLISEGETAAGGIGSGKIYQSGPEDDLGSVPENAVLIAPDASPRYVKILHRLNAVVTEKGSAAGHFASVAREFGVPTLVNVPGARKKLPVGATVTVDADHRQVYEGAVQVMLDSPCARRNLLADSPFMRRLGYVMDFVSPLDLVDPEADNFTPEGCRSFHDIIRFCHEKAVHHMFHVSDKRMRKVGGSKKLQSEIPMLFYVIDVGGGLSEQQDNQKQVTIDEITSLPMQAVVQGLRHPGIHWGYTSHFDWAEHDRMVMSGGIVSPDSAMFASHAVISADYANLNLRFGYHFVIVDAVCTETTEENYILFRFSGGGAELDQRTLRARFLSTILEHLEFDVVRKSDLVDAQYKGADMQKTVSKLDWLGRLLGATRLMDMYLKEEEMVDIYANEFMQGRYHFASVEDD